jgi:3-oxoacyl-[acyl-carrier protein] reductase
MRGQLTVVIGGSGAIGSAICRHFANAGATCIVTYNNGEQAAKDLIANLPGKGHSVAHIPLDDSAAMEALADDVQAKHGRLATLAVVARLHYSTGCIIAIDGGRPLA